MTASRIHLYSFLRHLVNERYARAQKDLEQIVEKKLRARASKAKHQMQQNGKPAMAKATAKMTAKKTSSGEKK